MICSLRNRSPIGLSANPAPATTRGGGCADGAAWPGRPNRDRPNRDRPNRSRKNRGRLILPVAAA